MAFFNNPQNLLGDRRVVINHHRGNQYNNYDAGGRRHSPYAAPADARDPRRPRWQPQNHRPNPNRNPSQYFGRAADGMTLRNVTLNFVGGQVIENYEAPPDEPVPRQDSQTVPDPHFGRGAHEMDLRGATFSTVGGQIFNNYGAPPNEPEPRQDFQTVADAGGEDIEMNERTVQSESTATSAPDRLPVLAYAYVAFRLDKDATVQSLQCPALIPAVQNMKNDYFVGYIEPIGQDPEFRLHLLRRDPSDSPMLHLTPQMSIPVLPTSTVDPESSRKPLRPDRELPWANCCHASSDHLVVRILPDGVESDSKAIITSLPSSETIRHSSYLSSDYIRRGRIAKRRMEEVRIAKKELDDLLSGNTNTSATLDDAALEQAQINVARARESSKTLKRALANQVHAQETAIMTVRISYDLSLVKDLPDPKELLDQQIYLADTLKLKRSSK